MVCDRVYREEKVQSQTASRPDAEANVRVPVQSGQQKAASPSTNYHTLQAVFLQCT